jgi:hypothetical protein
VQGANETLNSKVKFLKDREARESFQVPFDFFCVAKLDLHLIDEIMDTLKEPYGVLVANIHKCCLYYVGWAKLYESSH